MIIIKNDNQKNYHQIMLTKKYNNQNLVNLQKLILRGDILD